MEEVFDHEWVVEESKKLNQSILNVFNKSTSKAIKYSKNRLISKFFIVKGLPNIGI